MEKLFKDLVWDLAVEVAIKKLLAAVPFLGWGPLNILTTWAVVAFTDYLYRVLDEGIDMTAIPIKNERLKRSYDKASVELRLIAKANGIDSNDFRSAREKHKQALSDLVRMDS